MSLFPAYDCKGQKTASAGSDKRKRDDSEDNDAGGDWQRNASYDVPNVQPRATPFPISAGNECLTYNISDSSSNDSNSDKIEDCPSSSSLYKLPELEFDSTDDFYVDKSKGIFNISDLPKLLRPRYKVILRRLNDPERKYRPDGAGRRRVFSWRRIFQPEQPLQNTEEETSRLRERIKKVREIVANEPHSLKLWVELYELLGRNPDKLNRLTLAEGQLHMLETALSHNASNEVLLHLYVETANVTYPASEVAIKIEKLLEKDPFAYTLWTSLIMTTQGTMARCNVPDVLYIYERSMRRMHLGLADQPSGSNQLIVDTDAVMLKLFHNCILFLRQSSNTGHVFALMKLAIELNVPGLNVNCLEATPNDERPLIEFEELVLTSGMPMPEIWTRIERLRQAFNFLPYPQSALSDDSQHITNLDPQRCIYNDDVCHYIYPLKSEHNKLHLLLLIVQLMKMPFIRTNCLAERLCARIEQIGDSDAIEMMLANLGDRPTYVFPLNRDDDFTNTMLSLAKEMSVSPTFMPHSIGNELYSQCISSLLLKCAEAFTKPDDEKSRRIFIILWFRFERMRIVLHKLNNKLGEQMLHDARLRIRQLLRHPHNRRLMRFYTELGMFEFELLDPDMTDECPFRIFENIIISQCDYDASFKDADLMHAYVVYAEMLFARNKREEALYVLTCLAMERHATINKDLAALQREYALEHNLKQLTEELNVIKALPPTMSLQDYFATNRFLLLVRARCLMLCMLGRRKEACEMIQSIIYSFPTKSNADEWNCFLREQLLETELIVLQLPLPTLGSISLVSSLNTSGRYLVSFLEQALSEFPRNLAFLQRWSTLGTLPWYKLRGRLIQTKAGILSLMFMILAARCRFLLAVEDNADDYQQSQNLKNVVRNRIRSMFETFLPTNTHRSKAESDQYEILRRNSLYWRCYLRCLSDKHTSFETSKQCLLVALDECPWDKALYMDGATYVPQELGHLQDVMVEKQIRLYAIPEELDVLRET
ncbi:uncharacterized protein LOC115627135 [Scaptodrosophila lebanonensis]|uniref:Uncharacterized protein LOC115627135 n=1 Tax=Drosophila lebanonensis TaxID=7225 RepID=A0A6J2TUI2_DROLE|nr:uncharacterized protein LOC115627135 [Scaptodrosophila lebanonensis]